MSSLMDFRGHSSILQAFSATIKLTMALNFFYRYPLSVGKNRTVAYVRLALEALKERARAGFIHEEAQLDKDPGL